MSQKRAPRNKSNSNMSNRYLEEWMRENYNKTAEQYRRDDEVDVTGEDHRQLCAILFEISSSFPTPARVLDIGCGTGRHFHSLANVEKLVGIDISQSMLDQARNPVKSEDAPDQIELTCVNFYDSDFAPDSFHFIYSIGVFGNGCAITSELSRKVFCWLKPGGVLFFDVLAADGVSRVVRTRKWLRQAIYRMLPVPLQERWDRRNGWLPAFYASEPRLHSLLKSAGFGVVSIVRRLCKLPGGDGWKLQCRAIKTKVTTLVTCGIIACLNFKKNFLFSALETHL
jgi:SAM-dependent methyltransferase